MPPACWEFGIDSLVIGPTADLCPSVFFITTVNLLLLLLSTLAPIRAASCCGIARQMVFVRFMTIRDEYTYRFSYLQNHLVEQTYVVVIDFAMAHICMRSAKQRQMPRNRGIF